MMESGKVSKALVYLGLPTIVGLLMTGFYNFIDSFFVAQLGTAQMGAISIAYPLVTLIPGIGLLFGNGGAAYISELLGAGEKKKAEVVLSSTFFYCILASVGFQAVLLFLKPLLRAMGASPAVLPYAMEYTGILIFGFLFQIPSICLMNLVRAEGAVSLSTASQIIGSVVNVILDPIFIWPLGMGIAGSAWTDVIGQFISVAILLPYYLRHKSYLNLSIKNVRFESWFVKPIFKVGIPIFAINLFQSLSLSAANIAAAPFGDKTIAALGIANRVVGMTTFAITGFSRGYQTFISYNYGARHFDRIHEATRKAYLWSITGGVILSVLQIVFAQPIVGAFSRDPEVIRQGVRAMWGASVFFWTYGFQAMAIVYLLCIKFSKSGFIFSISRQGIVYLPVLILLAWAAGKTGIYYAQAAADVVTTVLILSFLAGTKKKRTALLQAQTAG
jgi:putative MATE family efflux protein